MSTQGQTPAPKTETVYEGPALPVVNYWAASPTVAAAPLKPGAGKAAPQVNGTVFDEKTFVPKRSARTAAAEASAERAIRRASMRFFVVAGITGMEAFFAQQRGDHDALLASGAVIAVFMLLGLFAYAKSKAAFLLGTLIYAAEAAFIGWVGYTTGTMAVIGYVVVVKGIIMYRLWNAYGMVCSLQTA
jgi:hypothetical protein